MAGFTTSTILIISVICTAIALTNFLSTYAITENPGCPSCVQIPSNQIELYKELFPLTIWTDQTVYDHDSTILLEGHLRPENIVHPVIITVTNPIGNIVSIQQLEPNPDGDFSLSFKTSSPLWKQDGTYIIKAQSGTETRLFKTNVELVSIGLGTKSECSSNEILTQADNGGSYCIPFKVSGGYTTGIDAFLTTVTKTLTLNIRGTNIESITLDLPRSILDAKSPDGEDASFIVLLNDNPINYNELKSYSEDTRKIEIFYPPDRKGKIDIIGTYAIPEFGSVGLMVLLIGISVITVVSLRIQSKKDLVLSY